ncbi:MAG: hypothetical protein LBL20_01685 [Treponema sp.]|nr:hypothetical protein [Treponema sp.]
MKKIGLLFAVCLGAIIPVYAEVTVGVALDAGVIFQNIDFVERSATWEPVDDPLWVGGYGRNGGNRAKLTLSFAANLEGKAGIDAGLAFYPWWRDNRQQDLFVDIDSIEMAGFGGWYRPFDWLRLRVGSFNMDTLRGKIGGFNWGDYLGAASGGTDGFFTRFEGKEAVAVELIDPLGSFFPGKPALAGFWAAVMIYDLIEANSINNQGLAGGYTETKYMFENIQFGIGYELPNDIGHVRLQYINVHNTPNIKRTTDNDNNDSNSGPRAQAAFAFTMIPSLTAEVGGTFSFMVEDPVTIVPALNSNGEIVYYEPVITAGEYQEPHRVALGAQYDFNFDLVLRGGVEYSFGGYSHATGSGRVDTGTVTKIWFSPSYTFLNGIFTTGADLGFNILGDEMRYERLNKRGGFRYGYGGFLRWNIITNCFIQAGVFYAAGEALGNDRVAARELDTGVSIPIIFHLGF